MTLSMRSTVLATVTVEGDLTPGAMGKRMMPAAPVPLTKEHEFGRFTCGIVKASQGRHRTAR